MVTLMPATPVAWCIGINGEAVPGLESTRPETTAVACASEAWSGKPHFTLDTRQIIASTTVQTSARRRRPLVGAAGDGARLRCFKTLSSAPARSANQVDW